MEARNFREVRINKRDGWRTYLSEAEPYSLDRARAAGFTRLLADAGYDSGGSGGDPRRIVFSIYIDIIAKGSIGIKSLYSPIIITRKTSKSLETKILNWSEGSEGGLTR